MESERQGDSGEEGAAAAAEGGGGRGLADTRVECCSPGELITVENYIIRFYLSENTLKLSVRALADSLHTQRERETLEALGHSYLAHGHHNLHDLQSHIMHHGAEKCT